MKLNDRELDFLSRVNSGQHLRLADREEDKARQRVRKLGLVECVMNPRRWVVTDTGRAALAKAREGET